MKSDRQTYTHPREPVNKGRFTWKPFEGNDIDVRKACNIIRLPALRKLTEKPPTGFSESDVGKFQCHSESDAFYQMKNLTRALGAECDVGRMLDDKRKYRRPREPENNHMLGGSCTPDQQRWSMAFDKPPIGFSESDVGKFQCHSGSDVFYQMKNLTGALGAECDIGRMSDDKRIYRRPREPVMIEPCPNLGGSKDSPLERRCTSGQQRWTMAFGRPPTSFLELDIGEPHRGEPPDIEYDIGRMMDDKQKYRRPREPENNRMLGGSCTPDQQRWSMAFGKPPTSFSEPDVGEFQCHSESDVFYQMKNLTGALGAESDIGRMLDDKRIYKRPREPEIIEPYPNLGGSKDSPLERGCTPGQQMWTMAFGKPPTGFSESDVGGLPGVECDVGRTLDESVSSELDTTRLTDDEIHHGCCLTL